MNTTAKKTADTPKADPTPTPDTTQNVSGDAGQAIYDAGGISNSDPIATGGSDKARVCHV